MSGSGNSPENNQYCQSYHPSPAPAAAGRGVFIGGTARNFKVEFRVTLLQFVAISL